VIRLPDDFELPANDPHGLNIRWPDPPLQQEARLLNRKLYAALAYCRANQLNRIVIDSADPTSPARLGIITAGKAYLDVRQALVELGIDDELAAQIGIRLYKVGMVWPLEADGVRRFAEGLEEILVVEEKRQLLEYQLKEELYNWREDVRPRVVGKFDEKGEWSLLPTGSGHLTHGDWLLPAAGELSVAQVARALAARIGRFFTSPAIVERLALLEAKQNSSRRAAPAPPRPARRRWPIQRTPYFCSGCPHNTSTRVPGRLARRRRHRLPLHGHLDGPQHGSTFTHMGGEGVTWVGQAPFTDVKHIFANLGDGTYFHSGLLAIRQSVAAGVSITYKILYNDAVAMTGGQPVDGSLSVPQLTRQLEAEGISKIVIVTDEPAKYGRYAWPRAADADPSPRPARRRPARTARTSRRLGPDLRPDLRHREAPPPQARQARRPGPARVHQRGRLRRMRRLWRAVELPVGDTGRNRVRSQAGDRPVVVQQGFLVRQRLLPELRQRRRRQTARGAPSPPPMAERFRRRVCRAFAKLPDPAAGRHPAPLQHPHHRRRRYRRRHPRRPARHGRAPRRQGRLGARHDRPGAEIRRRLLAPAHRRPPEDIHAARIATGEADAVIGGDLVVTAGAEALSKVLAGKTRAVVNVAATPTAEFTRNPDWQFPQQAMQARIDEACGAGRTLFLDTAEMARRLMGDALYGNLFLLGVAWQRGLVPLSLAAIDQAIELNGAAVERTARPSSGAGARRTTRKPCALHSGQGTPAHAASRVASTRRSAAGSTLTAYQDARYASATAHWSSVSALPKRPVAVDSPDRGRRTQPTSSCWRSRTSTRSRGCYADPSLRQQLCEEFEGDFSLRFHLAPPLLARPDPQTGRIAQTQLRPWMMTAFACLSRLKGLRGTASSIPFGRTEERRMERQLLTDYEADIELILAQLKPETLAGAIELAACPSRFVASGTSRRRRCCRPRARRDALRHCNCGCTPPYQATAALSTQPGTMRRSASRGVPACPLARTIPRPPMPRPRWHGRCVNWPCSLPPCSPSCRWPGPTTAFATKNCPGRKRLSPSAPSPCSSPA
jgi:indolepyruvate ferredoxin oxidoreductase